jgi:hypothetical protein
MFGISKNNRYHIGYGHQFNGQEINTVRNHKLVEEVTENGDGEYFWVIDLGYSRVFKNRITAHSELSIGGRKKFINYLSNTNNVDNYSLITDSKATMGMGLKVGYLLKNGLEPFIGIHTLKKLDFGLRLSW